MLADYENPSEKHYENDSTSVNVVFGSEVDTLMTSYEAAKTDQRDWWSWIREA